jgi:hypothetical protein
MRSRAPAKKKPKKKAPKKRAKQAVKKPKKKAPKKPKAKKPPKKKKPLQRKEISFKKAVKKGIVPKPLRAFKWLSSDNPKVFFEHFNRMQFMTGELDAKEMMTAIGKSLATKPNRVKKWEHGWAHEIRALQLISLLGKMKVREMAPALANVNMATVWAKKNPKFQDKLRHAVVEALKFLEPADLARLRYSELNKVFGGPEEVLALTELKRKFKGRKTKWPQLSYSLRVMARDSFQPIKQRNAAMHALISLPERENLKVFGANLADYFKGNIKVQEHEAFSLMLNCMQGLYTHRKLAKEARELEVASDLITKVIEKYAQKHTGIFSLGRKESAQTLRKYGRRVHPDIYRLYQQLKQKEAAKKAKADAKAAPKKKR